MIDERNKWGKDNLCGIVVLLGAADGGLWSVLQKAPELCYHDKIKTDASSSSLKRQLSEFRELQLCTKVPMFHMVAKSLLYGWCLGTTILRDFFEQNVNTR